MLRFELTSGGNIWINIHHISTVFKCNDKVVDIELLNDGSNYRVCGSIDYVIKAIEDKRNGVI